MLMPVFHYGRAKTREEGRHLQGNSHTSSEVHQGAIRPGEGVGATRADTISGERCLVQLPRSRPPDVQYSAKEISWWMSAPTDLGQDPLRRPCLSLLGCKRPVFHCPWQRSGMPASFSDTKSAECPKTRKSTSGGCLMLEKQVLKS